MELHSVEVKVGPGLFDPGEDEILVFPVGDIQYGPEACDVSRLKKAMKWAADRPNVYFVGMGDYYDLGSPSNRQKLDAAFAAEQLYDTPRQALDEWAASKEAELMEILEPTRGRWLGLLTGHHYWKHADGTTSDTRLAEFLEAPYLGDSAIVEARFPAKGKHAIPSLKILAHHGNSGAMTLSGVLTRAERWVSRFDDVDVVLMAHVHQKVAGVIQRLRPEFSHRGGQHRLNDRDVIVATTGSYLRGYMAGNQLGGRPTGTYVEKGMMPPAALGGILLSARRRMDREGYVGVDVSVTL